MEPGGARELVVRRWLEGAEAAVHDGWTTAAEFDELIEGRPNEVHVFGHPVVLVRLRGDVHAVDGYCPHRGMPLGDAHVEGDAIQCIWHGFEYDVRSGKALWPDDCGQPLAAYDTRIRDGVVELRVKLAPRGV